jgi:sulfatase maturation enzyme AslB (radical SAM superfamily)
MEMSNMPSFRQSSFDIIPETTNGDPIAIDINLDIECNAACIICNASASSLWQKELDKKNIVYPLMPVLTTEQIDDVLDKIDFSRVQRIKFFGGEPLFTDTHLKVLNKIPNPKQCDIWYTCNGSIIPKDEVFKTWSQFKLVYVEVSIDAVGNQFNYIRWPLVWDKVENNLLRLIEEVPSNVLFRINHTLNPFNVFYYDRLLAWVNKKFATNRQGDPTEINVHPCWGKWDLAKTPQALRDVIAQKYLGQNIEQLLSNTKLDTNLIPIKKFIDTWEGRRKNSWKETFPEIVEYFTELDQ